MHVADFFVCGESYIGERFLRKSRGPYSTTFLVEKELRFSLSRLPLRPLVRSPFFQLPQGLDTRWAVAHSPKLLQGIMAGVCDYYAFGLALRAFGAASAGWALLCQVLSWFNFYCLVRPYSNSAEAVLATAALFYWAPFFLPSGRGGNGGGGTRDGNVKGGSDEGARLASQETLALLLAALCVAVRPTSAALWVRPPSLSLVTCAGERG